MQIIILNEFNFAKIGVKLLINLITIDTNY